MNKTRNPSSWSLYSLGGKHNKEHNAGKGWRRVFCGAVRDLSMETGMRRENIPGQGEHHK